MRGVKLFHMPTTLLAMIDSAVGGKNGLNTQLGKNTLGTIYQPVAVFIDISWLHYLPTKQIKSAFYECYKYGILFSRYFLDYLIIHKRYLIQKHPQVIIKIIYHSIQNKVSIIEKDELETKGIRQLLNLGHTFGHAIEKLYSIPHGYAVGFGIYFIAKLSYNMGILNEKDKNYIIDNINYDEINKYINFVIDVRDVIQLMYQDKKSTNNKINLVLINSIEHCQLYYDIDTSIIIPLIKKEIII